VSILQNSFEIAKDSAVDIWAITGAQYVNNPDILHPIELKLQSHISTFALNSRRVLESFDKNTKFQLPNGCWSKSGNIDPSTVESDLWNSLNLIIHAQSLEVIFEHLPDNLSYIAKENNVVSYILLSTDRRKNVHVDPFAIVQSFLSDVQNEYAKNA